jgi:hypothetical protein
LGSIVIDQTNVFDHKIVDFPLVVDAVEFVVDGQLLVLICDDLGVHFRVVFVLNLARIEDVLARVGLDSVRVSSSQQPGENLDEFSLFLGAAAPPVSAWLFQ